MEILLDFSQNIALLLALTFLYGLIAPRLEPITRRMSNLINGVLFGAFAVISMTMPIQVQPGLFYDGRTIVICIAGIYGGVIPAVIAAAMVAVYRLFLGGIGARNGVGSALTAALIGILVYRYCERRGSKPRPLELLALGFLLAVSGLIWTALIPDIGLSVLQSTLPPTILLYPLGLAMLGLLINYQQRSRKTELALVESERGFHAIFDSSFQFIGLLKPDGTLLEINQTALSFGGVQPGEVIGQPFWDTHWWQISPQAQAQLKDSVARSARGELVRYEVEVWDARKRAVSIDFSLKPLRDESGEVVLLIQEGRDISSMKELEEQKLSLAVERERSHVLKGFISDVSHDLRTPLSVIRLNLDLLRRMIDSPKQLQRIETLAAQEQHLTQVLTDMMVMLSLDDERAAFHFQPLDLNFVAQLVCDRMQPNAQRKEQSLVLQTPREPLMVEADQVEMERALANLLNNAISYTPDGGSITILLSASQDEECAVIEFRDNGIGIAADDLPNIFQRFYRADRARSMDTGGTGLGLPIALKIVAAHGGRIAVESVPDEGSTFRVTLPLRARAAAKAASVT